MSNKVFIAIGFLLSSLFSSACAQNNKDYEYFLKYPEQIEVTLKKCHSQDSLATADNACEAANKAGSDLQKLMFVALQNRQAFGQQILTAQMQKAQYKQQIATITAQLTKLQNAPDDQKKSLETQLGILKNNLSQVDILIMQYLDIIKLQGIG